MHFEHLQRCCRFFPETEVAVLVSEEACVSVVGDVGVTSVVESDVGPAIDDDNDAVADFDDTPSSSSFSLLGYWVGRGVGMG